MLRLPTTDDRVRLVDVALGRSAADLIVRGGRLLNGATGEVYPADLAVVDSWIAAVGDVDRCTGPDTEIVNADGRIVTAGLIDAHFHIEGSMVTVHELARVLLPRGVTTLMCDPHEIGNVLGPRGMVALIEEAADLALKVFLRVPPQIPGTPGLETTGGGVTDQDFAALLDHPSTISVAGDCSPTWLLSPDRSHLDRLRRALAERLTVNGQEPGLAIDALNAFAASGPQDTHIATSCDMLLSELRLGLRAIINDMPGQFPDHELARLASLLVDGTVDCRHLMFCADDVHPNRLIHVGGVDAAVRRGIRCGIPWTMAVRMATINPATHYRVDHLFGSLAPGRVADIVVLEDEAMFTPSVVIADGKPLDHPPADRSRRYPPWAYDTVHVERVLTGHDFLLPAPIDAADGDTVEVIAIYPGIAGDARLLPGTEKQHRRITASTRNGIVELTGTDDLVLAAVIDRHQASGRIGRTLIEGFGIRHGAVASTVNHDNHNLMVIGADPEDMACAANAVIAAGGGLALAKNSMILELISLPIAGLLSDESIDVVARAMDHVERLLAVELGVSELIPQPIMLIQMFALANIPSHGLTDLGLIDVAEGRTTPPVTIVSRARH